jgi:hypothetical protein
VGATTIFARSHPHGRSLDDRIAARTRAALKETLVIEFGQSQPGFLDHSGGLDQRFALPTMGGASGSNDGGGGDACG